jgi:hypothetical protein
MLAEVLACVTILVHRPTPDHEVPAKYKVLEMVESQCLSWEDSIDPDSSWPYHQWCSKALATYCHKPTPKADCD